MLNVSGLLFASAAVGVKLYPFPAATVVEGLPEMVGGVFGTPVTVIEKGAREACAGPSETVITMFE